VRVSVFQRKGAKPVKTSFGVHQAL